MLGDRAVPANETVDAVRSDPGDERLAKPLLAIATISDWNTVNVTARVRIGARPST
jgi:hypothetical protein